MTVANHEYSSISVPATITSCVWQRASVTGRPNNRPVSGIGYKGVAGIVDLIGSADLSLTGIITASQGMGVSLEDYESALAQIIIQTYDPDAGGGGDGGKKATLDDNYVRSISFNFRANENMETTWNLTCDVVTWAASDVITPTDAGGQVDFPTPYSIECTGTNVTLSMVTAATFDATIDRTEVYIIGQKAPEDRPVTHPYTVRVTVETLAAAADLALFVEDFEWDADTAAAVTVAPTGGGTNYAFASGLRPVEGGINIGVGENSVSTLTFEGWHMEF